MSLFYRCVRAAWMAVFIASSVDRFRRYANCRGSRVSGMVFLMWDMIILSKHLVFFLDTMALVLKQVGTEYCERDRL